MWMWLASLRSRIVALRLLHLHWIRVSKESKVEHSVNAPWKRLTFLPQFSWLIVRRLWSVFTWDLFLFLLLRSCKRSILMCLKSTPHRNSGQPTDFSFEFLLYIIIINQKVCFRFEFELSWNPFFCERYRWRIICCLECEGCFTCFRFEIEEVGKGAFRRCALETRHISCSVESIEDNAFEEVVNWNICCLSLIQCWRESV